MRNKYILLRLGYRGRTALVIMRKYILYILRNNIKY